MRVEPWVRRGVRVGHMDEAIADDERSTVAAAKTQPRASTPQEVQRPRRRLGHRTGERHAATVALRKDGNSWTELECESQPHRGDARARIGTVAQWKNEECRIGV